MKLKQEFVLREIAGDNLLIPVVGAEDEFHGIITFNETGVYIWKLIEQGKEEEEIVEMLTNEYDVTKDQARKNVEELCEKLKTLGVLE